MRDTEVESRDMPWRCAVCDSAEIVAVRPGSEPLRERFLLKRDIPLVAYCRACWAKRWRRRAEERA